MIKATGLGLLISLAITASSSVMALPGAVCGNGKHVGNPHCSSNTSPAPVAIVGAGPAGAAIILAAGFIGYRKLKKGA